MSKTPKQEKTYIDEYREADGEIWVSIMHDGRLYSGWIPDREF